MKKCKFVALLAAVLSVLTFSSCLDGESSSTRVFSGYVKVGGMTGSYSFSTPDGYQIIPLNQNVFTKPIDTRFAFLNCTYESDAMSSGSKTVSATLISPFIPIESKYPVPSLEGMTEAANAPISNVGGVGAPINFGWSPSTMFVPLKYFVKTFTDSQSQQQEFNAHTFEMFYDVNDKDAVKGQLVLHLRHSVVNPEENKNRQTESLGIYHFDLSNALFEFESAQGSAPRTIVVEYEQNYTGEYGRDITPEKVEVDYQTILQQFSK